MSRITLSDEAESTVSDGLLPPREKACHRARGRQGQALRVTAKRRPSLTAVRHGSAIELRSGRKNGFAEVEQKNAQFGNSHANFSCSS
jgi:hypothetical protein